MPSRRYIVPALIVLLLSLLAGKLLLTPVKGPPIQSLFNVGYEYFRGWPWVYSRDYESANNAVTSIPRWSSIEFSYAWLLVDLCVLLAMIAFATLALYWRYRRSGSWLRFSLRGLLLLTTIVAIAGGWASHQHRQWQREQHAIANVPENLFRVEIQYRGPEWLRRLWPADRLTIFNHVVELNVDDSRPPADSAAILIAALPDMPYVRYLTLNASLATRLTDPAPLANIEKVYLFSDSAVDVSDSALRSISSWPHLRALTIDVSDPPAFTDRGLAELAASATLEEFYVPEGKLPQVTDAGIVALARAPRLNSITLPETQITDAAMKSLAQMPGLKSLTMSNVPKLTDRGIHFLADSKSLRGVTLPGPPQISEAVLQALANKTKDLSVFRPDGTPRRVSAQ